MIQAATSTDTTIDHVVTPCSLYRLNMIFKSFSQTHFVFFLYGVTCKNLFKAGNEEFCSLCWWRGNSKFVSFYFLGQIIEINCNR